MLLFTPNTGDLCLLSLFHNQCSLRFICLVDFLKILTRGYIFIEQGTIQPKIQSHPKLRLIVISYLLICFPDPASAVQSWSRDSTSPESTLLLMC